MGNSIAISTSFTPGAVAVIVEMLAPPAPSRRVIEVDLSESEQAGLRVGSDRVES